LIDGISGSSNVFRCIRQTKPAKASAWGVSSVAHSINVKEQSESNTDCNFHSYSASIASGRSYHKNILMSLWKKESS